MMRTLNEVQEEIGKLIELREKIPPTTFFGDSNLDAIDAQIWVLEGEHDEDEVNDEWPYPDEDDEEDVDIDYRIRDNALEAVRWLEGDEGVEAPSKGWEPLANKE